MRGRSMMEGLMAWTASMDWRRARFLKEFLTVREAREWLVSKRSGHVSLTQLNPIDLILLEIVSKGCWLKPSATTVSKWDTQFTHASFTLFPFSFTIHLSLVCSGKPFTVWRTVTYSSTVIALFVTIGIMFFDISVSVWNIFHARVFLWANLNTLCIILGF